MGRELSVFNFMGWNKCSCSSSITWCQPFFMKSSKKLDPEEKLFQNCSKKFSGLRPEHLLSVFQTFVGLFPTSEQVTKNECPDHFVSICQAFVQSWEIAAKIMFERCLVDFRNTFERGAIDSR